MIRTTLLLAAIALALPALGCLGTATVSGEVTASPRLVEVSPGVWLVEDHYRAIYFYDGLYWWQSDGIWYQSDSYDRGFIRARIAPRTVIRAYRPRAHVRYRATRGSRVRTIERRDHREQPRKVRDNRRR